MITINLKNISLFQDKILHWYGKNKRDLPWRKTRDPFAILISEIMLQQTQVERAKEYYHTFLKRFPTPKKLACARQRTVLALWSGLGYNNRALHLQKLAIIICKQYKGVLPRDENKLVSLPGIGPYTARAILAFAFNKAVPVFDTNIRRVIISEFMLSESMPQKELEKIAYSLIPKNKSRIWHNALMDYGALVATAKVTGISPPNRQSKFKGSDRWLRGLLVKSLIEAKKLPLLPLKKQYGEAQLIRVLNKLNKEKIITEENGIISLW